VVKIFHIWVYFDFQTLIITFDSDQISFYIFNKNIQFSFSRGKYFDLRKTFCIDPYKRVFQGRGLRRGSTGHHPCI